MALYRFLFFIYGLVAVTSIYVFWFLVRHGQTGGNLTTCIWGLVVSVVAIYSNYRKVVAAKELLNQGKSIEQPVSVQFLVSVMVVAGLVTIFAVNHFIRHH